MHGLRMQDLRQHTLNVLVVDDEELNLEIISELLGDRGYHVDTADSGVLACRLLQQNSDKYHCVLLDRMMPELDGMAVLQFMKNDPQLRYIPVIMQTAKATRKDIQDGINAGVLYYITKPFNETTLLNIVDSAVAEYLEMQALTQSLTETRTSTAPHGQFVLRTLDEARQIASVLANACPDPERVVFGLAELLINAVEHGNLGIDYAEKTRLINDSRWGEEIERRQNLPEFVYKKVSVSLDINDEEIRFIIKDEGDGFDSEQYLNIDPERACSTHGRGIAMARMVSFDSIEYKDGGATVVACVKITRD